MNPALQAAIGLAAKGVAVFPCKNDKSPAIAGGFKAATCAPNESNWPAAGVLVGVPTGAASYDVLDVDIQKPGVAAWWEANASRIPPTEIRRTRSGGFHVLFRHHPGLRCSAGKVAPGVDVRSTGGYVIDWFAAGLEVETDEPLADWPEWLLAEVLRGQASDRATPATATDLAPPDAQAAIDLLERMPNLDGVSRDVWVAVMLAAAGCVRGLDSAGADSDGIAEAAVGWAAKWPASPGYDSEWTKWEDDWSQQETLTGWRHLQAVAGGLLPGYSLEVAQGEFTALAPPAAGPDSVAERFNSLAWQDLDLPAPARFLGDFIFAGSRTFVIGRTGLGKSQFTLAMACHIATGHPFLRWKTDRSARVLVIDGEMGKRVMQKRVRAAVARHRDATGAHPGHNLIAVPFDRADECAGLGKWAPFNTDEGRRFALQLIAATGAEVVVFDNVMALLDGEQKDEIAWKATQPLVEALVAKGIAQIWVDHTGHNTDRQYGSSTKAWAFDAALQLTPSATVAEPGQIIFDAHFAKTRHRDGDNWDQFADMTVRLGAGGWSCAGTPDAVKLSARARAAADVLDLLGLLDERPVQYGAWRDAVKVQAKRGDLWPDSPSAFRQAWSRAVEELLKASVIGVQQGSVTDTTPVTLLTV